MPVASPQTEELFLRCAWIAGRLSGVAGDELGAWVEEQFDRPVTKRQFEGAVTPLRPLSRRGRPRQESTERPSRTPAIFDWLRVDEREMGLIPLLVRLPNDGLPRPGLVQAVAAIGAITEVAETEEDLEIIARALVESPVQVERLRAQLEELVADQRVRIHRIGEETRAPAVSAYSGLAQRLARGAGASAPSPESG